MSRCQLLARCQVEHQHLVQLRRPRPEPVKWLRGHISRHVKTVYLNVSQHTCSAVSPGATGALGDCWTGAVGSSSCSTDKDATGTSTPVFALSLACAKLTPGYCSCTAGAAIDIQANTSPSSCRTASHSPPALLPMDVPWAPESGFSRPWGRRVCDPATTPAGPRPSQPIQLHNQHSHCV